MSAESAGAETAVAEMIAAAGIKRMICVDDAFAAGVNDLVEILAGFTARERAEIVGRPVDEMAQEDLWQQRVRELWDGMTAAEKASLVDNAYATEGHRQLMPLGSMQILRDLVPGIEQEGLTLQQWRDRRDAVLAELGEKPTLILFDQDFAHEGGAVDDGQRLITDLESALEGHDPPAPDAFYGLLTNTVGIGDEHQRRGEIIAGGGVSPMRFVLISKQNLQDRPGRFAARLRTMLLAPIFAQLMQEVSRAVSTALERAMERAGDITPEDLEHIVVHSSDREGVWPPDTLLRILQVMQRAKVRESLRHEGRVVLLTERLLSLADVTRPKDGIAADAAESNDANGLWAPVAVEISHEEIYETAEHINGLHLPVELGDLFERSQDGKRFVVIAQPCDLMVRAKGVRMPDLSQLLLAEVGKGAASDRTQFASFELPYYKLDSGESAFVKLGRPATVRAMVLDACVLNADGRARLELEGEMPPALMPYSRKRGEELHKMARGILTKVAKVPANAGRDTRQAVGGAFKRDPFPLVELDPESKIIAWDCVRVGRVCDPYARALLARFSQYFARDAYLHDLARR